MRLVLASSALFIIMLDPTRPRGDLHRPRSLYRLQLIDLCPVTKTQCAAAAKDSALARSRVVYAFDCSHRRQQ